MSKSKMKLQGMSGVALGLGLLLTACGSGLQHQSASDIKVTNGEQIAEDRFPAVVFLVMATERGQSICTGTFVNDHQLITAGHCVAGQAAQRPELYYVQVMNGQDGETKYTNPIKAISLARNPQYSLERNNGVNGSDLAVVNFPANTAPSVAPIANQAPTEGDPLTIVGYGNNENSLTPSGQMTGSGSGIKRSGTNTVRALENGFISFYGVPASMEGIEQGEWVASGAGDSGGPMFVGGQLVGVTSGGGLAQTEQGDYISVSHYVNLNSDESQSFLSEHLEGVW
jgi:secreted trypsin-like serine protease